MDVTELRFGRFRLDPIRRVLLDDGTPARLGSRAVDLLLALAQRRERVVSKRELFDVVWPNLVVEENNLQQHISALRKLLGPQAIATVPGRGYQLILALDNEPPAAPLQQPGPAVSTGARRTNLPAQLPLLIGRDADIAELRERLATHAIVTLVGPGGIGKTRLAQAAAHACSGEFADGAWAVDLSVLTAGAQVSAAVANELAIRLATGGATGPASAPASGRADGLTVASALRGQKMLLLLDNCEHVLDQVAALVEALRQHAPHVHVLATSQQPLDLADEQIVRLAPLALPPKAAAALGPDDAARYGAVQLFVKRAQAVDRFFVPTPANLAAVVDICRRLDGLPLAIELAAARTPLLGVHGLRERLDERLRVLATRRPRAPLRQQTLRAALAWSHALLSADEQTVFRRLAVFSGGFSIDLAQRVLADEVFEPWTVLDLLGTLVDKSLLMADAQSEPRYRLLESARAFALEQLELAGETDTVRHRHAQAMCDLLQAFDHAVVHEPRFEPLVGRLEAELDNLRAAMQWLAQVANGTATDAQRDAAAACHMAITLAATSDWLWIEADPYGDGLGFCRIAREWLDDSVPVALASRLRLAYQTQARARLLPLASWSIDARLVVSGFRAAGDRVGLYRALCLLGGASRAVVGDAEAAALLHEAEQLEDPQWSPRLRMCRQVSLEWWHDLGGRLEQCREAGLRHLALARAAGGKGEIGVLANVADTEFALGHVDEAIALCRQAIERAAALSRPTAAINAYENMVPALLERGKLNEADAAIRAGRALRVRALGSAFTMLMPLALLAHKRGEHRLAAQLIGCADHAYAEAGQEPHPPERRMREAILVELEPALSPAHVTMLMLEGTRWSEDDAFACAGLD